jgi:hypothetical protein
LRHAQLERWILPLAVLGSSSMNLIQRGYLNGARRSFTNAINSVSSAAQHSGASRGTQNPIGFTKPFSSNLADLAPLPLAATLAGEISHGEQRLLEVAMLSAIARRDPGVRSAYLGERV